MPVRTVRKQRGGIKHVRVAGAAGHDGEGRDSGEQVVRVQIPAVPLNEIRDAGQRLRPSPLGLSSAEWG